MIPAWMRVQIIGQSLLLTTSNRVGWLKKAWCRMEHTSMYASCSDEDSRARSTALANNIESCWLTGESVMSHRAYFHVCLSLEGLFSYCSWCFWSKYLFASSEVFTAARYFVWLFHASFISLAPSIFHPLQLHPSFIVLSTRFVFLLYLNSSVLVQMTIPNLHIDTDANMDWKKEKARRHRAHRAAHGQAVLVA